MADINIFNKLNDDKTSKYIELDDLHAATRKYANQMGGAIVTNTYSDTQSSKLLIVRASTASYNGDGVGVDKHIKCCVLTQVSSDCRDNDILIAFKDIEPLCEQLQNIKKEYETAKMEYEELLKKVDPIEVKNCEED